MVLLLEELRKQVERGLLLELLELQALAALPARPRIIVIEFHQVRVDYLQVSRRVRDLDLVGERRVDVVIRRRALVVRAQRECLIAAADLPQVVERPEFPCSNADVHDAIRFLLPDLDDRHGLVMARLREAVFQRGAGVADDRTDGRGLHRRCAAF